MVLDVLASLVFVPRQVQFNFVPRHAGVLWQDMLASVVLLPGLSAMRLSQEVLASLARHGQLVLVLLDMLASVVLVPGHAGQPGHVQRHDVQPGVHQQMLAMLMPRDARPAWHSCQNMLASLVLVPRHAGQPGALVKTGGLGQPADMLLTS
ncbi:unnamed protein product, partial [Effrenium voratum]